MRNKLAFHSFLVLVCASACTTPALRNAEKGGFRAKYPYTVLGDSMGFLPKKTLLLAHALPTLPLFRSMNRALTLTGNAFLSRPPHSNARRRMKMKRVVRPFWRLS